MNDNRKSPNTPDAAVSVSAPFRSPLVPRKENGMSAIASPEQLLATGRWHLDPGYSLLEFRVSHLVIESVKGRFLNFNGAIWPGETPYIVGSVEVASLDTNHRERDAHLRSADFFDVKQHPEILF